ncbi:MAG TPA: tryptophan synthase subunit alpha [Armatimonadetes bacterium]|nr:tryptophan synthase subunit alpha [Armatimonadota bacterium]
MSRLEECFAALRARGEKGLIPYLTAGDPSLEFTARLVEGVAASGADIVELGIPFSDPLMDGPVIQASAQRALQARTTPAEVLALVAQLRPRVEVGLVLMTCYNLVFRYGLERFAAEAQEAGVDGILVTDLPPEEAGEWEPVARAQGLDTIYLVAPTSTPERLRLIAEHATGFIYCVSRRGVTGVRKRLPPDLTAMLARIRAQTDKPIAVGFGISTPEHVRQVVAWADAAVVGSALVQRLAAGGDPEEQLRGLSEFVRELKEATLPKRVEMQID